MGVADLNYNLSDKPWKEKREAFKAYIAGAKAYEAYNAPPPPAPKPT